LLVAVLGADGLVRGFAAGAFGFAVWRACCDGAGASVRTLGSVGVADAVALALGCAGTFGGALSKATDGRAGSTSAALAVVSALGGAEGCCVTT
jgi:hypothetical protein